MTSTDASNLSNSSDLFDGIADATSRAGRIYADFVAGLADRSVAPPTDRPALREAFLGSVGDEVGTGVPAPELWRGTVATIPKPLVQGP